ncbi:MAG: hypothetical protein ACI4LA_07580 [Emergencia sp.]
MGDFRDDCRKDRDDCCDDCCCERRNDCCCRSQCCCDGNDGNIWGILILLFVLWLLFCNNDGKGGGLFGGLF